MSWGVEGRVPTCWEPPVAGGCGRGSGLGDPQPRAEARGGGPFLPSALDSPRLPVVGGEGAGPLPIMPEPGSFLSLREKSAFLRLPPAVAEGGSPGALGWGCRPLTVALGEKGAWSSPLALPPLPLFPPRTELEATRESFIVWLSSQPSLLIPPGHWTRPDHVAISGLVGGPLVSWHRIKR